MDSRETCWTVLRAATRGDRDARSTFGALYEEVIRRFFRVRWRGRILQSEVDDAVQEVLVECLKPNGALDRADPESGDFRGLLYGVSRNVARRFEERATARGRLLPEDDAWIRELPSDEAGQETQFDRHWAKTLIRQSQRRQLELARADGEAGLRRVELLERRFRKGEEIHQIAAAWRVPAPEVHQLYRMARAEFHRCMREVVRTHSPQCKDLDAECRHLLSLLA